MSICCQSVNRFLNVSASTFHAVLFPEICPVNKVVFCASTGNGNKVGSQRSATYHYMHMEATIPSPHRVKGYCKDMPLNGCEFEIAGMPHIASLIFSGLCQIRTQLLWPLIGITRDLSSGVTADDFSWQLKTKVISTCLFSALYYL